MKKLLPHTLLSPHFIYFSGYFQRLQSGKSALPLLLPVVVRTLKVTAPETSSAAESTYVPCHISDAK